MSTAEQVTITMPTELAETLRQTVAGGEYASTSEAVRDWVRNRDRDRRDREMLQEAIEAGIGSGTGIPADQVFTELRSRFADMS